MTTELSKSLEEYLKVAYELEIEDGAAAASDIADKLDVKAPSVTSALKRLSSLGLIEYRPRQNITLTKEGKLKAEELALRYRVIRELFLIINVPDEIATKDACEIEHLIHQKTLQRIIRFVTFLKTDKKGIEMLKSFNQHN